MSNFSNALTINDSLTQNGAVCHSTSDSALLDFFFYAGSMRKTKKTPSEEDLQDLFILLSKAMSHDFSYTIKNLFYLRDIRGGQGEREVFRQCLKYLIKDKATLEVVRRNLAHIPEYGRWDDLFIFFGTELETEALSLIKKGIFVDKNGLCAKWMPRKGIDAIIIRKFLNLSPREYRKLIVELSKTVEQQMCSKKWEEINYSHVPSKASKIYQKAFDRNDNLRYQKYLSDVLSGKSDVKINASAIYPHEVLNGKDRNAMQAQWNALPDYLKGSENKNILPVCDVSGSMMGLPMDVCTALGAYISERNKGPFKDHVISFTDVPQFIMCTQKHPLDKVNEIKRHCGYNTNLMSVFKLILEKAKKAKLNEEDMPSMILVLSDMQFDPSSYQYFGFEMNAFKSIKKQYAKAGYKVPCLVWWNLASVIGTMPVKSYDDNVALVSGFSPSIMKTILSVKNITPLTIYKIILDSDRYANIN